MTLYFIYVLLQKERQKPLKLRKKNEKFHLNILSPHLYAFCFSVSTCCKISCFSIKVVFPVSWGVPLLIGLVTEITSMAPQEKSWPASCCANITAATSIPPPLSMQCLYLPLQGRISLLLLLPGTPTVDHCPFSCDLTRQTAACTSPQEFLPNFTSFSWETHPLHSFPFLPLDIFPQTEWALSSVLHQ